MSALIKEKTCAFSGHRILSKNFDENELKNAINALIAEDTDTFLVGMALGFDTVCFKVLEKIRELYPIKIVACVPCADQYKFFNKKQKAEYDRMLASADEVINLSKTYYDGCMFDRNKFMVDNCSALIAYLNFNRGGTYQTVRYAVENNVKVIYIPEGRIQKDGS